MKIFFCVLIIAVPVIIGRGVLHLLYGKNLYRKLTLADTLLVGGMFCIGLAEMSYGTAVIAEMSLSDSVFLFSASCMICVLLSFIVIKRCFKRDKKYEAVTARQLSKSFMSPFCFVLEFFIVLQIFMILNGNCQNIDGDMTLETVNSFLAENTFYQVNPLNGMSYQLGMPQRLKLLCLPALYSMLCRIFQISAMDMVWKMVPSLVLLASYLSYSILAKIVFPKDFQKRYVMLIIVGIFHFFCTLEGFRVINSGFRGTVIRGAILIPYLFSVILRRKWKLAIVCILTEACIVWTLYGLGVCFLITVIMAFFCFFERKKSGIIKAGRKKICGNS